MHRSRSFLCGLASAAALCLTPALADAADCTTCDGSGGGTAQATPDTSIASAPSGTSTNRRPMVSYSASLGSTSFTCRWAGSSAEAWSDAGAFACGEAGTAGATAFFRAAADLADGPKFFQVRACKTYTATETTKCDQTPAKAFWSIDTTGPTVLFDEERTPAEGAHLRDAVPYTFGPSEFTFEPVVFCWVDGVALATCRSGQTLFAGATTAQGEHTIGFRARDFSNNEGPLVTRKFVWDTVAPATTIRAVAPTAALRPSIPFSATDADEKLSATCTLKSVAGDAVQPCSATGWTAATDLAEGTYALEVRHTDRAGNVGTAATRSFVVDRTVPKTTETTEPTGTGTTPPAAKQNGTVPAPPAAQQTAAPIAPVATAPQPVAAGAKAPATPKATKCRKPRGKNARNKKAKAKYNRCVAAKKRAAKKRTKA